MAGQFNDNAAVFELGLDASKFKRETRKAEKTFSAFASKTSGEIYKVSQTFTNYLANDLAGNAIKTAFESSFEFLGNFAQESKQIVNLADKFKLPVDTLQELQAVAKGAEVDLGGLVDAANALDLDALGDFDALSLNLPGLEEADQAERFAAVVDALAQIPDATQRAEAATRLFGDAASNLSPILDGAVGSTKGMIETARQAGLITGEDAARGAAQFAQTLERLKGVSTALANEVATVLLPVFEEGAGMLIDVARYFSGVLAPADDASKGIERAAESMRRAREEGDRLRQLDAEKFKFAEDLADQGTLVESTFEKAVGIIDELQKKYGDLGFSVDAATKSITLAAGAQGKFNEAASQQAKAELEREIAAAEENERGYGEQIQKKLTAYESFGARIASAPRNLANFVTGGVVESTADKWEAEIKTLGDKQTEERKRLSKLRARLKELNEGNEDAAFGERSTASQRDANSAANPPGDDQRSTASQRDADNVSNPPGDDQRSTASQRDADNASNPPGVDQSILDRELEQFETRAQRASQSTAKNQLDDVQREESDYRAKIDERIAQERSKGKSGQDETLVADLEAKKAASVQREQERTEKIRADLARQTEESDWLESKEKPESKFEITEQDRERIREATGATDAGLNRALKNAEETESEEATRARSEAKASALKEIDQEASEYRELLEARRELATTDAERTEIERELAALTEETERRKEEAASEIDSASLTKSIQQSEAELEEPLETTFDDLSDLLATSLESAQRDFESSAATFSGAEASSEADAATEKTLTALNRQTTVLENIERAVRNGTSRFA